MAITMSRRWRKRWTIPGLGLGLLAALCAGGELRCRLVKVPEDGPLIAVEGGGKWGYIAANGAVAVPLDYDYAAQFIDGQAWLAQDNIWLCIDRSGAIVAPKDGKSPDRTTSAALSMKRRYTFRKLHAKPEWRPAETFFCGDSQAAVRELLEVASPCLVRRFRVAVAHMAGPPHPAGAAGPQLDSLVALESAGDFTIATAMEHPWLERPVLGKLLYYSGLSKWPGFSNVQVVLDAAGRPIWRSDFHAGRVLLLPAAAALGALSFLCLLMARRAKTPAAAPVPGE